MPTLGDIVDRARRLPECERLGWVRQACHGDDALAMQILEWIDHEGPHATRSLPGTIPVRGQERIGPWRLVRSLGRGGMGEVFLAERADRQFHQQAAIKIVAPGRLSPNVLGRLRIERQILASLEHPNIARLLDGGSLADGTPYIVMEYVAGEPIDVYCDARRLDVDARIELFTTVCAAVHCAHQNLVVHRDLKPSNILVTSNGRVKLLDFGIAKLLDARQALHTLAVTHADFRMLTPDHASPEQVRGQPITTASDVYVLGVLLHELLTGSRPFDLPVVTFGEIERAICERPVVLPGARFASLIESDPDRAAQAAACRSTTPARLRRRLTGDLDNIVGMAMRREPRRRYASAEQLAEDLRRHRNGDPVIARPDTRRYRALKFVGRHRAAVAAAAGFVGLLAAFALTMWIQAGRIAEERDLATLERSRAEQVSSFLVDLFELSDPMRPDATDVTARELLDTGARRITAGLADQPQTRALLLGTMGRVYGSLGLTDRAIELMQESARLARHIYGDHDPRLAVTLRELGDSRVAAGDFDRAAADLAAALEIATNTKGAASLEAAAVHHSLGRLAQQRGDLADAEAEFRRAAGIHVSGGHTQAAAHTSLLNDLAGVLTHRAAYEAAAALYQDAIAIDTQLFGRDHPQLAQHVHSLAVVRQLQGRFDDAAPLFEQSIAQLERLLGESHPQTIDALANYGRFLEARGDLDAAEETLRLALARNLQARGPGHPYVGYDHVNLGLLLHTRAQNVDAEHHFRAALGIYARTLPPDHLYVASARVGLGRTLTALGRLPEARAELERGVAIWSSQVAADNPQRLAAVAALDALSRARQTTEP